ncbi:MAG: glycosyltransferase family 2 protein [Deltaproteobacteria bacterium]|nr:MAG: glycosyltransferase family 2 protein [Deltaproteobacteria bacterium]
METGTRDTGRTDPASKEGRILFSACVCTYRRPDLLGKLLDSLEAQVLPEEVDLEVVVVDNDPGRSGAPIVRRFTDTGRTRFSYFVQPVKNISLTRNVSVRNASGEYLLFIDDDEVAPPNGWNACWAHWAPSAPTGYSGQRFRSSTNRRLLGSVCGTFTTGRCSPPVKRRSNCGRATAS